MAKEKQTEQVVEQEQISETPMAGKPGVQQPEPPTETYSSKESATRGEINTLRQQFLRYENSNMNALSDLRAQVSALEQLASKPVEPQPEGILATMIADVYCPECGLKLDGNSATGPKLQFYVHPFASSPKLGGEQCRLRGQKFQAPKIFLPKSR